MKGTLARRCAAWLLAAAAMLLPVTSGIGQEDRKAEIFAIVDRNAQSIAEMSDAVYYFAELGMQEIESAKLVATPGCYVTAASLALAPLVRGGLAFCAAR